ncbi:MAG: hypothetical protein IT454_04385 [Planctomycetes bacterium]|nr:hypothetical protein [Planctomycetota bacterium]
MKRFVNGSAASVAIAAALMTSARAQTDIPAGVHATSEHWTLAGSPYRLKGQVYFAPGATLTIDAGVVVASIPGDQGSLAIARGAMIIASGTQDQPIIFTSTNDVATWSGTTGSGATQIPGDHKTGAWREAINEWGNVTLMGRGYVAENAVGGNTPVPSPSNVADMEGLTNGPSTDRYGGGDDNDDSGTLSYVSLRYGGKVVGLNNELNGLSLGGVGRATDIHHVEIMNGVDDGIEIWGGAVNLKYVSIWNVGDDSFDVDQGWRGKVQFGLIVQGHSADAAQGSGVGDNAFETDGAENSDWQPVTTSTIYNCTVIGQPVDGDHGMAFRDNARIQYRNCVFMDLGERVVSFDNVDGDGGSGYGFNGTLSWANTWTTAYNAVPAHANDFTSGTFATNYPVQSSGRLIEVTDSVFFRNQHATAYTEANARAVFDPANNNVLIPGFDPLTAPIVSITRGAPVVKGGKTILPVTFLDPRPANQALTSVASAPADGFFSPASYRGAFAPSTSGTWLGDWSAAAAFGFVSSANTASAYCTAGTTTNGCVPSISATGFASGSKGSGFTIHVSGVEAQKQSLFFYGINGPFAGAWGSSFLCVKAPTQRTPAMNTGGTVGLCDGSAALDWNLYVDTHLGALGTPFIGGETVNAQLWFRDPPAPKTTNLSNGLQFTVAP